MITSVFRFDKDMRRGRERVVVRRCTGWEVECDLIWYDALFISYEARPMNPNGMV